MLKKTNKLDNSMLELLFEVPAETWVAREAAALEVIGKDIEMDGFRKGKVPHDVLKKNISEMELLERMAELEISQLYPKVIIDEKIAVIGRPEVMITKLARGNALEFTVKTAVLPEMKLPDYKKIAKAESKEESEEVTEADLEKAVKDIQQMRAHQKMHDDNVPHEAHDHGDIADDKLEPLTEDFVKSLGNFQSVEEFKEKLRDNLKLEKKMQNKDKNRTRIIEKISSETDVALPTILIDAELEKMQFQLKNTVERAGLAFDQYMQQLGKTAEDMRKDFLPDAEKRAKMELVLFEIGKTEKLLPTEADLGEEVAKLQARYPDADKERLIAYVEQVMTNERVFEFLEKSAEEK